MFLLYVAALQPDCGNKIVKGSSVEFSGELWTIKEKLGTVVDHRMWLVFSSGLHNEGSQAGQWYVSCW